MLNPPAPLGDMLAAEILLYPPPTPPSPSSSEIHDDADAPRFLYVSNRNFPSATGDPIAIFSLADRTAPQIVREVPTALQHVRGIAFSPDGRWLVAGGAKGGGAKVFRVVERGAGLEEVARCELDGPTHFLWV